MAKAVDQLKQVLLNSEPASASWNGKKRVTNANFEGNVRLKWFFDTLVKTSDIARVARGLIPQQILAWDGIHTRLMTLHNKGKGDNIQELFDPSFSFFHYSGITPKHFSELFPLYRESAKCSVLTDVHFDALNTGCLEGVFVVNETAPEGTEARVAKMSDALSMPRFVANIPSSLAGFQQGAATGYSYNYALSNSTGQVTLALQPSGNRTPFTY